MYGKVFESIYDGTLAGHWQAIVTMQQLIVLATPDGIVDMTPEAIARRTTIPLEIITAGLEHLAKADPYTRTPGEDGRRIVLLDDHRPWGWRLVNHGKYQRLRDMDQKREADRERMREKRKKGRKNISVASESRLSRKSPTQTHTQTQTQQKEKDIVGLLPDAPLPAGSKDPVETRVLRARAVELLAFLNEKAGRNYEPCPANIDFIVARLREGATVEDCRAVIAKKCREWLGDTKMNLYLRPETLFNRTKFAGYKGELVVKAAA